MHNADYVRVFLVWDTDQMGVSLYGIYATRQGAEDARRSFKDASWIEEREIDGFMGEPTCPSCGFACGFAGVQLTDGEAGG